MDCNGCEKKGGNAVPYIAHEADMSRLERTIRRLWVLLIVMLVALVMSNLGWIMYESQFEDNATTTEEVQQDIKTDGSAIVAGIGDAIYGYESETESQADNH